MFHREIWHGANITGAERGGARSRELNARTSLL